MTITNALAYTVKTDGNAQYKHAYIEVFYQDEASLISKTKIRFAWQTDREEAGRDNPWYAVKIVLPDASPDAIKEGYRMMTRITKPLEWYEVQPEDIIDRLERMKAAHMIFDERESRNMLPDDILPPQYDRYVDDYKQTGKSACTASVMAYNEIDAQQQILMQLAERTSDKYIMAFLKAGKPVINTSKDGMTEKEAPTIKAPADYIETF